MQNKSKNTPVKATAEKPRRTTPKTSDRTPPRAAEKSRTAEKPRAADKSRSSPPRAAANGPARGKVALAKIEPVKPRRVGTKLSRLLDSNPLAGKTAQAVTAPADKPVKRSVAAGGNAQWLLYCRPGFENDCAQEALRQARQQRPVLGEQPDLVADCGHLVIHLNDQQPDYRELIFARQLIRLHHTLILPERDRLTPILTALSALPGNFAALWLEVADTNDGKTVSAFTRRFQPLLETALREQGRLTENLPTENRQLPRLHLFFPDKNTVLIGSSDAYNSSPSLMGIHRQSMPAEAPSRSTLKLAEAIEVFLDKSEQTRLLRSGMTAVDLGAAPGGWTWQMVKRGIRTTAVDNGPMKGVLVNHPLVEHLKQDGFKFTPKKAVDWLICDMVEKPGKVAELMGEWFVSGWCKHAIFNLKLPMKQRNSALDAALGGIKNRLTMEGISYKISAKQLYHDREEITVFLSKTRNR